MRRSLKVSIAAAAVSLLVIAQHAQAQETHREPDNRGCVLYFSLAPEIQYSDTASFRGLSFSPGPGDAIVNGNVGKRTQVAYLLAAFPPEAVPQLSVVTFGLRYSKGIRIVRSAITPVSLNMATQDWPGSGEGIMFGMTEAPDTNRVIELMWFAFEASGPGVVEIVPHPYPQNALRVVSRNPVVSTPIAEWGSLGFGMGGRVPDPVFPGPSMAACCTWDSACIMLTRREAEFYGPDVVYLGDEARCIEGGLCRGDAISGACCLPDGSCQVLTNLGCARVGGIYRGNYVLCDTVRCEVSGTTPSERKGP